MMMTIGTTPNDYNFWELYVKRKDNPIFKFLVCLTMVFSLITTSYGHSGRTDSNGGHTDSRTGNYHYHSGPLKWNKTVTIVTISVAVIAIWYYYSKSKAKSKNKVIFSAFSGSVKLDASPYIIGASGKSKAGFLQIYANEQMAYEKYKIQNQTYSLFKTCRNQCTQFVKCKTYLGCPRKVLRSTWHAVYSKM